MNGHYVGELYLQCDVHPDHYEMVGASMDNLPLELPVSSLRASDFMLDTSNDFLAPMGKLPTVRVGAWMAPQDNDKIRGMVAGLPRRSMTLTIKNGFIEHVLEAKKA